jgi:hypothetical protein
MAMADKNDEILPQEVEITWEDVEEFAFSKEPRLRELDRWVRTPWSWQKDLIVVQACAVGAVAIVLLYPASVAGLALGVAAFAAAPSAAIMFRTPWGKRFLERSRDRAKSRLRSRVGLATIELSPGGVRIHGEWLDEWWSWTTVSAIEASGAAIHIETDGWHTMIAPRRCFADQKAFDAFAVMAEKFRSNPAPVAPSLRGERQSPPFRLSAEDVAASTVATAPSLVPGWWAIGFAALMAAPMWRMFPLQNPEPLAFVVFPVELAVVGFVLVGHKLIARRYLRRSALSAFAKSITLNLPAIVGYDRDHIFEQSSDIALAFRWGGVWLYAITARVAAFHTGDGIVIVPAGAFPDHRAYLDFVEGAVEARRAALAAVAA